MRKTAAHTLEVSDLAINSLKSVPCPLFHCAASLRRVSPESEETTYLLKGETQILRASNESYSPGCISIVHSKSRRAAMRRR
jgi:hypothetical protein